MFANKKKAIQKKEEPHPDPRVASIEKESGISFADVKIHYASDKPKEFGALAYAYGNDVYLGSGQEKHLKHELGHVVQQRQGIVSPTMNLKGIPINLDYKLEKSANIPNNKDNISEKSTPIMQFKIHFTVIDFLYNQVNMHKAQRILGLQKFITNKDGRCSDIEFLNYLTSISAANNLMMTTPYVITRNEAGSLLGLLSKIKDGTHKLETHQGIASPVVCTSIYRWVCSEERDQIVNKHGLIRKDDGSTKAIWVVANNPLNTNVRAEYCIRFDFDFGTFVSRWRSVIDLDDDTNTVGETDAKNSILYKSGREPNCFGIGSNLLDTINAGINIGRILDSAQVTGPF